MRQLDALDAMIASATLSGDNDRLMELQVFYYNLGMTLLISPLVSINFEKLKELYLSIMEFVNQRTHREKFSSFEIMAGLN